MKYYLKDVRNVKLIIEREITVKKVENFDILEKYNELITLIFVSGKKQFV